ncbi:MAG TPA: efflux transporter outer membrane subunit [Nevskiaceae bacterium]|nr:efflux transporter outer membrane subunit [Nevskiaceae bacterium]
MKSLEPVRTACIALGAAVLTACTVGPAYRPPAAPQVPTYTAHALPGTISAASGANGSQAVAQTLQRGATVNAQWWTAFASPALNALVAQALAHNPTLTAAQATLEQSRAELKAAQGIFYPHVGVALGAERTRGNGAQAGPKANFGAQIYNLYTGQVNVSYNPGIFGLNRLVTRAAQAQVDLAADQLDAARLTIAGNVVTTTLDLAALDEELATTRRNVHSQQQALKLIRTQYQLGAVDQSEVFTQESLLASSQAQLTQLAQARDSARHLLATYLGEFPGKTSGLKTPRLATITLPAQLPLSLPSQLVQQRPDIRAAEAQLRAANAQVGEAVARMYPNLQLTAAFGTQANLTHTLFDPASRIWDIAAGLAAPLFEGGTLRAQKHAAQAAYRAVFADYQATVLDAFRNVADVLRALQHDSALLGARARALHAAQDGLRLVTTQYQAGQVDFLSLLTSETQVQTASVAFVAAKAQRLTDTAALYTALGGGQWQAATQAQPPAVKTADAEPGA